MAFTKAQEKAISLNRKSILVSAAAGSGKTTVLTARIMRKLLDVDAPLSLSDMLVVTYTKAAASELKVKIRRELQKAIVEHPENRHLAAQLFLLPTAQISTIHSFCYQLLKEHFQALGLPAQLRIMDSAEKTLLCEDIMNDVINAYYNGEYDDVPNFSAFADSFLRERDDRLAQDWLERYETLTDYVKGIDFLQEYVAALKQSKKLGFAATVWGKKIIAFLLRDIGYYLSVYRDALALFESAQEYQKKHYPAFLGDRDMLVRLERALTSAQYPAAFRVVNDYQTEILDLKGARLGNLKTEQVIYFCEVRDSFKSWFKSLSDILLLCCDEINEPLLAKTAEHYETMYRIFHRFEERLNAEKKERGLLDYGDLERYTIALLYTKNGEPSEIAHSVSEKYKEVFIDEYQDVNETQDLIFRAICDRTHSFMVGDIKQSIYQFRGADPSFFSKYRDSYTFYDVNLDTGSEEDCTTLFLSNNFRCDRTVIDTVNHIFGHLFTNNSRKVPYYDEDALIFSKTAEQTPKKVQIAILDSAKKKEPEMGRAYEEDAEVYYVANEIKRLIEGGVEPREIAILSRDMKGVGERYEQVLKEYGISLQAQGSVSFLDYPEIKLMLSLLHILDNPASDIDLAAVLLSPLFSFTMDELIEIRQSTKREKSLYAALNEYTAAHTEFEKGAAFLKTLGEYRAVAFSESVDQILWYLYRETGILYLVYQNVVQSVGDAAKKRLLLLYDYAKRFESTSFSGLYRFLYYLQNVIRKEQELPSEGEESAQNAVSLLTIHKSKGLEFKVCFVVKGAKNFSNASYTSSWIFSKELGISEYLRDESGILRYDTPLRSALKYEIMETQTEEEMRLLYVALTRAKEQLYVVASLSKRESALSYWEQSIPHLCFSYFIHHRNYLSWIMPTLLAYSGAETPFEIVLPDFPIILNHTKTLVSPVKPESMGADPLDDELYFLLKKRFGYQYEKEILTKIPAKFSTTELYPSILDDSYEGVETFADRESELLEHPSFLSLTEEGATAAQRGTATHIFMQFCDFAYLTRYGVAAEIRRLAKQAFITEEIADLIDTNLLEGFLQSSFYRDVWQAATELHREIRFNIQIPAIEFTTEKEKKEQLEGETVFVQGVIDCILKTEEGYIIVDYKTDSFSSDLLKNKERVRSILRERHAQQLSYYCRACEQLLGERVRHAYIYSFALQELVEIPVP